VICNSIIVATIITGYLLIQPKASKAFTEFYLLGPGGKAENYPEQLTLGETGNVTVGIIDHENKQTSYLIKVLIASQESNKIGPILLGDGEKWEGEMSFAPTMSSDNQEVEFLLFKGDETTPANSLHLWVDVKDRIK
jgi:uncharacterized membrane protein